MAATRAIGAVEDVPAVPRRGHQLGVGQRAQMLREPGDAQADERRELVGRPRTLRHEAEHLRAHGVAAALSAWTGGCGAGARRASSATNDAGKMSASGHGGSQLTRTCGHTYALG